MCALIHDFRPNCWWSINQQSQLESDLIVFSTVKMRFQWRESPNEAFVVEEEHQYISRVGHSILWFPKTTSSKRSNYGRRALRSSCQSCSRSFHQAITFTQQSNHSRLHFTYPLISQRLGFWSFSFTLHHELRLQHRAQALATPRFLVDEDTTNTVIPFPPTWLASHYPSSSLNFYR